MTQTSLTQPAQTDASLASLPSGRKLLLLLCNAIPLFQVITVGICVWLLRSSPWLSVGSAVVLIYLIPPLLCRCALSLLPIRRQMIPLGSRDFFVWWFTLNLQMLLCRLPFLEEILRLVPGCYSLWLRLWGARIGKLTYWAAGLRILDRPFLRIGDQVTFGAGVRLNAHVIARGDDGKMILALAPISIGHRANVGGYSLLVAGSEIAAGECTRACLALPPFNRFEGGRRCKPVNLALDSEAVRLGADGL